MHVSKPMNLKSICLLVSIAIPQYVTDDNDDDNDDEMAQKQDIQFHRTCRKIYTILFYKEKQCTSYSVIELNAKERKEIQAIAEKRYDVKKCNFINVENPEF